jgi:hypothetical protein
MKRLTDFGNVFLNTALMAVLVGFLAGGLTTVSSVPGCTPAQVKVGLTTANALLHVVQSVLLPSIESTRQACESREHILQERGFPDDSLTRLRQECTQLNDALLEVERARSVMKVALESGDDAQVDSAITELKKAATELEDVVAKTWLAPGMTEPL